jgi:hypothetical protein
MLSRSKVGKNSTPGGFVCPPERNLSWTFIRGVASGLKLLPRAEGPEAIENLPKFPELSACVIFAAIGNSLIFRQYFPDVVYVEGVAKIDRTYLLSVLRWLKPGMISLLLRAAHRRKTPIHVRANQNNLQDRPPGDEQNQFIGMFDGQVICYQKSSKRAAYWMLSPAERGLLQEARENDRITADRDAIHRVIMICFEGKLIFTNKPRIPDYQICKRSGS